MSLSELLRSRRSIRSFLPRPVEPAKLELILEAANGAPSAGNLQSYRIMLIERPEDRERLAKAAWGQIFVARAPLNLVFCADPERAARRYGSRGRELYCVQDASIACAYAQLAAQSLGLGSVWVGAFDDEEVRRVADAEGGLIPVAILSVGYAAENPPATPRRRLSDLARRIP